MRGGSAVHFPMVFAVAVQEVVPDSNPGFRTFWPGDAHVGTVVVVVDVVVVVVTGAVTVSENDVVVVPLAPVAETVTA